MVLYARSSSWRNEIEFFTVFPYSFTFDTGGRDRSRQGSCNRVRISSEKSIANEAGNK